MTFLYRKKNMYDENENKSSIEKWNNFQIVYMTCLIFNLFSCLTFLTVHYFTLHLFIHHIQYVVLLHVYVSIFSIFFSLSAECILISWNFFLKQLHSSHQKFTFHPRNSHIFTSFTLPRTHFHSIRCENCNF